MFYVQSDSINFSPSGAGVHFLLVREEDATDFSQLRHGIGVYNSWALQRQRLKNQRVRQILVSSFHFLSCYIILIIGSSS
jgi:ABC-type molybdenum transport system ATPase subunit/photorepair protein PhrA